jgi:signal transduction histidine kinase
MLEWLAPSRSLAEEELPCLLVARDGRVLETSAGARRIVGGVARETRLAELLNLAGPELEALLAARSRWTGECALVRADGRSVAVRLVAHAGNQDILLFLLVDLNALTDLQEELGSINSRLTNLNRERAKEAARMARALEDNERLTREILGRDRIKQQFYANMSHELRAPLNSIIGFTEDALDGLAGPLTPEMERFLTNVMASSRHLLHVATEMLDLSKLQSGRASLELEEVVPGEVLADLAVAMAPLIKRKQQTFTVPAGAELPPLRADRAKLYQVLLNLATNAHKYTPGGGHVAVTAEVAEGRLRLAVADTGVGISKEDLPLIFEEYRQVRAMPGVDRQGTGLGLAIARRLVELHGGAIRAESEPGKGSTFTVELPLGGPA